MKSMNDYSAVSEEEMVSTNTNTGSFNSFVRSEVGRSPDHRNIRRIIRKLEGYLCDIDGDEATVCFIDNGTEFEMIVPARPLLQNKIKEKDQPFEYIESEVYDQTSGLWENTSSYIPLCSADEFSREPLPLSLEMRKKLNLLLKRHA